jgi:hypothetical protein
MKFFTIQGERCSGTHFVQYALLFNFIIEYKNLKEKHFFGFNEDIYNAENSEDTLFIYVIRHPIDWIDSFFKRLHHVPEENKKKIQNFTNNEFYSIYEEGPEKGTEIMEDRNLFTKERYKDIFELRKTKNEYMLHHVRNKVKHFLLLRYEDLRDDFDNTLKKIQAQFNLKQKHEVYKKVPKYKGTFIVEYVKKPILLSEETQEEIKKKVDKKQELEIGYSV